MAAASHLPLHTPAGSGCGLCSRRQPRQLLSRRLKRPRSVDVSLTLGRALQSMEGSLRARTRAHLAELALLNLASMYELSSSMPAKEAKAGLAAWAYRVAPEDFDMACLRLDEDRDKQR